MHAKLVISMLTFVSIMTATATTQAVENRNVAVSFNEDCSFVVNSKTSFGELYINYWTSDFKKLSEFAEFEIQQNSFTAPLRISLFYIQHTLSAGGEVVFYDAPPTAKSRDDLVKLVLPASFRDDLNVCLETLPCPCDIDEFSADNVERIRLSSWEDKESHDLNCQMIVYYPGNTSKTISLQAGMQESRKVYNCRITAENESIGWDHYMESWHQRCRQEVTEFVTKNIDMLAKQNTDKTFCPFP